MIQRRSRSGVPAILLSHGLAKPLFKTYWFEDSRGGWNLGSPDAARERTSSEP
jgi:hypothetical protein